MKKLFPVMLLVLGIGTGVGAGVALRPDSASTAMQGSCDNAEVDAGKDAHPPEALAKAEAEYVQLNNQFVVPVVNKDIVEAMVVLSLGIELDQGQSEALYAREPKLRDALLQVLFDHANIGGFRGNFTDGTNMDVLRGSLTEAAQAIVGGVVRGVMITDIARQDV